MNKSFIRTLAIVLTVILASTLIVACDIGGSKKDKKDKDKDSDTSKTFDVDTMQADLEEAGYLVSTEPVGEDSLYEGAEHVLVAYADRNTLSVYFFDTEKNAKTAYEQLKEGFELAGEDCSFKTKGNIIYGGSDQAIKDAKIETSSNRPSNKPGIGEGSNVDEQQTHLEEDYVETAPANGYETERHTGSSGIEWGSNVEWVSGIGTEWASMWGSEWPSDVETEWVSIWASEWGSSVETETKGNVIVVDRMAFLKSIADTLAKAGYDVEISNSWDSSDFLGELVAQNGKDYITISLYGSQEVASAIYESLKYEQDENGFEYKIFGTMVMIGSDRALADAGFIFN